jgi:putative oxidoreductase
VFKAGFQAVWTPRILSVVRMVTGLQYLDHGSQKLLGFPYDPRGPVHLLSLFGVQGCLEFFGGLLILSGLFTRPVAFILSGNMAVAYFMVHAPKSFFPAVNDGDAAISFSFIFLLLAVAGGGSWGLDALRQKQFFGGFAQKQAAGLSGSEK